MVRDNHDRHTAREPTYDRPNRHKPAIEGPNPDQLQEAFDALIDGSPKDTPSVGAVRTLRAADIDFPLTVHNVRIIGVSIKGGEPMNGAMRSDDHISYYEVEYPQPCPKDDCHSEVTRYKYSTHGFEYGSEETFCPRCDTLHESEEWG